MGDYQIADPPRSPARHIDVAAGNGRQQPIEPGRLSRPFGA
jgi:hypothetical protein